MVEVVLVVLGAAFVASPERWFDLVILAVWDALAGAYVGLGALAAWRARPGAEEDRGPVGPQVLRHWWGLVLTVAASAIGMVAAARVAIGATAGVALTLVAAGAMILAWMLVHVGFARVYSSAYRRPGAAGGGLEFPGGARPRWIDFLYLAFTVGVSFATSDVTVTRSDMRWRVLLHSVLSFFYNAAVIVLAIGTLTDL